MKNITRNEYLIIGLIIIVLIAGYFYNKSTNDRTEQHKKFAEEWSKKIQAKNDSINGAIDFEVELLKSNLKKD